jgi:serine/threonine protein kinase
MIIVSNLTFEKIKQIGTGQGMNSTVWLVYDHQFKCDLAIKEIDKSAFWNPNCFAEAQTVYAVDHPNVVRVQYACELGNSAYIAMPYYANGSLTDRLRVNPLRLSKALVLAQDVLLGLTHIHSNRFVHLDIKPSNIFFDSSHRALIADFGQSRQISPAGHVSLPRMYKRLAPPEVVQSMTASYVSDVYQVGAMLYRSLNGEQHWQEQVPAVSADPKLKQAILRGKFPDRNNFLPHIPKRLRTVLRKAMSVDVSSRYQAANLLADDIGKISLDKDWALTISPSGEMFWSCDPSGCAQIKVELTQHGSEWKTEIYTEKSGSRRAKGRDSLWGTYPSRKAALAALKDVFEQL